MTVTPAPPSPEFADAKLSLANVKATKVGDSVKLDFDFTVSNYELKSQTPDAASKNCNNSEKGQHIHFILDDKPYAALYEPKHSITIEPGGEHYVLAFLSRSYHESIKHKGASVLYHFKTSAAGRLSVLPRPTTAMLFYSRPKGDYLGKDTANLLFDFYPVNTPLDSAHQVIADINGKPFTTATWTAYFIQHLPLGKNKISIRLADAQGNTLPGPMTEVTREFTLAADEPLR